MIQVQLDPRQTRQPTLSPDRLTTELRFKTGWTSPTLGFLSDSTACPLRNHLEPPLTPTHQQEQNCDVELLEDQGYPREKEEGWTTLMPAEVKYGMAGTVCLLQAVRLPGHHSKVV